MKRSKPALKAVSFTLCCLITFNSQTAVAHNAKVHEGMTKRAYQIMLVVTRLNLQGKTMGNPPPGVTAAQWKAFHADIAASMPKLDLLAKDPNKTIAKLADATSAPDYYTGDIHLFAKPSNMLGQSAGTKMADEAAKNGALVILVPLVCGVSCLGELLGVGNATCKTCIKKAKELSEEVPTPSDLANLIPGIGDIASKDYTGVWHFINLSPAADFSDHYDDHPGLFYERAGPFGTPGVVDVGILAVTDGLGLSVNPEKSDGVSRYQIANANDSFPDGDKYNSTLFRSGSQWQKYAMGHTTFEPLDNFALWGWREFQTGGPNDDRLGRLGYPLHAIGDATVPMHVTGTTSWGHRPFEDAQARLWDDKISDLLNDGSILAKAYEYRQEILAWRVHGHPGDIPIRHLIRSVAKHTLDYSSKKQSETGSWPFEDSSSLLYFSGTASEDFSDPKEIAIGTYSNRSDAGALVKPLFEDGIAAELAVLMSAAETNGVARQEPASSGADLSFSPVSWREQPSFLNAVSNDPEPSEPRNEAVQRRETPAQIHIADLVKTNYARLGRLLIIDEISPAEYLQRLWNQTSKAKLAARDSAWADELAGNDKDGDLVPDSRDRCPDTPPLAATDATGCPTRERLPNAPSRRAMQSFFSRINIMVSPKCPSAPAPRTPQLVKIGTSTGTRDLMFAVRPLGNQTANCTTFYEFGVRFKGVFEGNKNFLPENAYREVVFRNTDSKDLSAAQNRLVFRVVREPAPQDGDRSFMLKAWGSYSNYDWRVRVVNANGLASEWSDWRKAGSISFNEP